MNSTCPRLIDPRYEISAFKGLIDPVLFQEILRKRIELEEIVDSSELYLRLNKRHEKELEANAVKHLTEIEPDIKSNNGRIRRLYIKSAMDAWTVAKDKFKESSGRLTIDIVKQISEQLTGTYNFRMGTVYILGSTVPVTSAESIERELNFVLNVTEDRSKPAHRVSTLERAFLYHHHIVRVHPFNDGNGRSARMVQNVALYCAGLPAATVLPEERTVYLNLLENAKIAFTERRDYLESITLPKLAGTSDIVKLRTDYGREIYLGSSPAERTFYEFLATKVSIELQQLLDRLIRKRK